MPAKLVLSEISSPVTLSDTAEAWKRHIDGSVWMMNCRNPVSLTTKNITRSNALFFPNPVMLLPNLAETVAG